VQADGDLTVEIGAAWRIALGNVFIGASGQHPSTHRFALSATDASTQGWAPHVPGTDAGVYIGRDPATGVWRIYLSNPSWIWLDFDVSSAASLSGLAPIGFPSSDGALSPALLVRGTQGFTDATTQSGVDAPLACDSVAAGDFDDDMDVDLFLACTSTVANLPDVLPRTSPGRAAVPLEAPQEPTRRGDTVTVADYDETASSISW
jgi:hypothetical protein